VRARLGDLDRAVVGSKARWHLRAWMGRRPAHNSLSLCVQVATGLPSPKHFARASLPVHFIENQNVMLGCLRHLGVNTAGVTAEGAVRPLPPTRTRVCIQAWRVCGCVFTQTLSRRCGGLQSQKGAHPAQRDHAQAWSVVKRGTGSRRVSLSFFLSLSLFCTLCHCARHCLPGTIQS
jgi:hypothetical protein